MALQFTPNPRATGNLSLVANPRARISSVVSLDWDFITNKPSGALSAVNDTNVTASLTGGYTAALLDDVTVTLGWTGTLSTARGGLGQNAGSANGVPLFASGTAAFTGTTGTGNFVRDTSPTLVTPALGTPSSVNLANGTNLPLSGLASQAAYSLVLNNTGSPASPTALAISSLTQKTTPAGSDLIMIQDQAASGQLKYADLNSLGIVFITPEKFGAVGDGTTDDTAALQLFLNACGNSNVIGVFKPGKTYRFGASGGGLFVKSYSHLIGYGATLKALTTAGLNSSSLNLTDATQGGAAGPTYITIEGLTIDGNATARRAGGAFSGVGNAASFYCVNATHVSLRDCVSLDSEADGFYFGGNSGTGGPGYYFEFDGCYATGCSRNGFSLVGANRGTLVNCIAASITYGDAHGNISYGFDFEPDGASTSNDSVNCISCIAVACTTVGFGVNNTNSFTTKCNWISCITDTCGVGFYSANASNTNIRIFAPRVSGNTSNFSGVNTYHGYTTGEGGTVTQATSKSTAVALNTPSGAITMNGAALAAGTIVSFTLTNNTILAGDVLILNHVSGGTPGAYSINARCGAGSATIDVRNNTSGSLSEAIVIQYALVRGATS